MGAGDNPEMRPLQKVEIVERGASLRRDVLRDAAGGVVRVGGEGDDQHEPEQGEDDAEQVGLVVHAGGGDVDDLDRGTVHRPAGRRPLLCRAHPGESRQSGLPGGRSRRRQGVLSSGRA